MIRAAVLLLAAAGAAAGQSPFAWKDHRDGRTELLENGRTVLVYNYGPQLREGAPEDRRRCCYIFPLFTPAGVSVLDDFPKDHWHHRGIFWAWPVVETREGKYDLWGLQGVAQRLERIVEAAAEASSARLVVENGWYAGGHRIVRETLRLTVFPTRGEAREFEAELRLEALDGPVTLRGSPDSGKSYGGFSARFAPRTGTVLRADGAVLSKDEDLNPHRWAELEGSYGPRRAVLRITADSANQWCLRHYGFVGASFPGRTETVQGYTLEPGKPLTLRFRLRAADLAATAFATEPKVIPLWPGAAPGSEGWNYEETETIGPKDTIRRIGNVTRPVLLAYLPDASLANGTAVIVCPGGGFRILAIDHEGLDVAHWLNSMGVAAFVLKYRLIRTGDADEKDPAKMAERRKAAIPFAVADGQQAIRLVRSRAAEWGLAQDRIGIMGFSAGGYLAAAVALRHDPGSRPDFAAPIYPAAPDDVSPPADAPPLFLVHADDDRTLAPLNHSIRLYAAWKEAKIPAELHIYSRGGHGFGMRKAGLPSDTWTDRFRDWLDVQGLLKPAR